MEKLDMLMRAKSYVEKMANGINPLDDSIISETDVLNNVRLSRCLFFVADVLREAIDAEGKPKRGKKIPFSITLEQAQNYEYSQQPIPASVIARKIYALAGDPNMKKLRYGDITTWLIRIGMLQIDEGEKGNIVKQITPAGLQLGISMEARVSVNRTYSVIVYNQNAQKFILENINAIVETIGK